MQTIATVVLVLTLAPAVVFGEPQDPPTSSPSVFVPGVAGVGGGELIRSVHGTRFAITSEQLNRVRLSQASAQRAPARQRGAGRTPMLVGALVGGATGMAFGAMSYDPVDATYSRGQLAAIGGGTLAAVGAFMGWLVNQ